MVDIGELIDLVDNETLLTLGQKAPPLAARLPWREKVIWPLLSNHRRGER